jgi:hypothetical protein
VSLTVTLNVFSGRLNPTWAIPEDGAAEFTDRISRITTASNLKPAGVMGGLGYRGFTVRRNEESDAFHIHGGLVDAGLMTPTLVSGDRDIETWLLSTATIQIPDMVRAYVEDSLKEPIAEGVLSDSVTAAAQCPACAASDAPGYNPTLWNVPAVQPHNNCYNYANNQITNTFAQPGRATGKQYTQLQQCAGAGSVESGAILDGLATSPHFSTHLAAGQGWYVALVLWPGSDYHWYRQDKVGCWSHKPGSTAARNLDNAGKPISDPKTANRGPYTVFCTYMITKAGVHIR